MTTITEPPEPCGSEMLMHPDSTEHPACQLPKGHEGDHECEESSYSDDGTMGHSSYTSWPQDDEDDKGVPAAKCGAKEDGLFGELSCGLPEGHPGDHLAGNEVGSGDLGSAEEMSWPQDEEGAADKGGG